MAMRFLERSSLAVLAVAVGFAGSAAPANAERYLFDMLFGDREKRQVQRAEPETRPQAQVQAAPKRRAVPKVSSPSYYNYRPEALVRVDLSEIAQPIEADDAAKPSAFEKAVTSLSDFDLLAEKNVADAMVQYYTENPAFIWIDDGRPNDKARAVLGVLNDADKFGLSETDYVVNPPDDEFGPEKTPEERLSALVRFEMTVSARALRYARDANLGRVDPNKLSGYHDFPGKPLEEGRVLNVLANTSQPGAYLKALHPQNELYSALVEELSVLRESTEKEVVVAPDTFVRPGGSHPEFAKVLTIIDRDADAAFRDEHGAVLAAHMGSDTYAPELVPVIKAAQERHNLNPDGIVGRQTVGALSGDPKAMRVEKVLMALERLRWHPSHLGSTRVMINAAGYTAAYFEDGQEKLSMRTVVGKPSNQTSFFHDEIEYVEFNPYWGVPQSIIVNEMLPKLRRDPYYLDRAGYEVTNSRGQQISSAAVNWWAHGSNIPFNVRQKPGKSNALGELKIMFPNSHAIYMHDTPQKHLFSRDTRAYSHGCVRLQEPRAMAAAVLGTSVDDIGAMVSQGGNTRRNLDASIPVYVGYFTAWPDATGDVSYHHDIYGRDDKLKTALAKVEEQRSPGS